MTLRLEGRVVLGAPVLTPLPIRSVLRADWSFTIPFEAAALQAFGHIHRHRHLGRPGDNAYAILEGGGAYVQALAPDDRMTLVLEAVSPRFAPGLWTLLGPAKARLLGQLGFEAQGGGSPNFAQQIGVEGPADIRLAARIAAVALGQVFGLTDEAQLKVRVHLPRRVIGGATERRPQTPADLGVPDYRAPD